MEELDFKSLLDRFNQDGFQKGERVILSNFGTNQTLLSIIFDVPNRLELIDQRERDGEINRHVELYCGELLVCKADTLIPKDRNRPDVIKDITAGELGLGQIVVKHDLPNRRNLLSVGHNANAFWRVYEIEGPDVYLKICEYFPREPFVQVGWLQEVEWPNLEGSR